MTFVKEWPGWLDLKPSWLVLRPGWLALRHPFCANDMIVPDSFRVSELDSRHSVVHGVTVALYQFFCYGFLLMP